MHSTLHHRSDRRRGHPIALIAAAVVGVGVALAGAPMASATSSVASAKLEAPATTTAGTVFEASVTLTQAAELYGYSAVIAFDPLVLAYVEGSATAPAGGFDTVSTEQPGRVEIIHTRLGNSPPLAGDIRLTLTFTARSAGSTALTLTSLTLVDPELTTVTTTNLATTSITVTQPPPGVAGIDDPAIAGSSGSGPSDPSGTLLADPALGDDDDRSALDLGPLPETGWHAIRYLTVAVVLLLAGAALLLLIQRRKGGTR